MSDPLDMKGVLRALDEFGPTLNKTNEVPVDTTATIGDGVTQPALRKVLNTEDRMYLQRQLSKLTVPELVQMWAIQREKSDTGIPFNIWSAGNQALLEMAGEQPILRNALDTTGGAALIRQDLEPILYSIFVKVFPAWDRFPKQPANGVVHTWQQITDYGDAQFMTELGTVIDDTATYVRQTTNIAVLGTRRGVSFKEQLAVPAGGMSWDAQRLEIEQGLTAMAHKMQKTIFQGQASDSGGTASNELGLYDANGFTGLRSILNTANAVNFQPYLTTSPDEFTTHIGEATVAITDAGGMPPNIVYMRAGEHAQFNAQERFYQRFVDRVEVTPGVMVSAVATPVGLLPVLSVPGDSIGTYTASTFDSNTVADIYVCDDRSMSIPYLGSPGPTVLEIPPGVSGQLTRLSIIWMMAGLAVKAIPFSNKLRADLATS